MQRQKVRVILASEHPQARDFLREVVEEEGWAVIVGQSGNASKALTLSRNLRPDIAIIDCYLPHVVGLDGVPLSRIGGLDTAQTISEQIPNTRVLILNNLDVEALPRHGLSSDVAAFFSRETTGASIPLTLQKLYQETEQLSTPIFANVEVQPRAALQQGVSSISDKAIFFGSLGILGGLGIMLTVTLAEAGVFVVAIGAMTMLFGLMGKWAMGTPISANVEVQPRAALRQKVSSVSDKAIFFSSLGILVGLSLMLSATLARAGAFVALAGAVTMLLGLVGKLTASLWPKILRQ